MIEMSIEKGMEENEYNKNIEYVQGKLTKRDALEAFAEESSELAKAALKLIRARKDSDNVTPTSLEQAKENLEEEIADVLNVLSVYDDVDMDNIGGIMNEKARRWAKRLGKGKEVIKES